MRFPLIGCRRFAHHERGRVDERRATFFALHARRRDAHARGHAYSARRQPGGCNWLFGERWQTDALLLLEAGATVAVCHRQTRDLALYTRSAELIVVAAGHPKLLTAEMVKPDAVVIDVGIHRTADGKLCGDVDFDAVRKVAGFI